MARKAVLITGAAKRIGRAAALSCAKAGYDVVVHYGSSRSAADDVAQQVKESGVNAISVQADLGVESDTQTLIERAARALGGPITNLINNASLFEEDDWDTAIGDLWNRHMAINLRAPYLLSRALAKQLPDGVSGAIVNLVDQRVWRLNPTFFSYTLSKSALWSMTQTLAQALAPNIRVNAVGPGPVLQSIHQDAGTFENEAANTLLEASVDPDEIAEACVFLLSAAKVTGQMIAVDSGQHLSWKTPDVLPHGSS